MIKDDYLKENDFLSSYRGLDLRTLIEEIMEYELSYSYNLDLDGRLTFGVELEYEGPIKEKVDKYLEKFDGWKSRRDGSLDDGGEIISPVLTDLKICWYNLKRICDFLAENNAITNLNAGGHIHIGSSIFGKEIDLWKNFIKLYTSYEHILFRYAYGNKVNARKDIDKYASPLAKFFVDELGIIDVCSNVFDLNGLLKELSRYSAVNFNNVNYFDPTGKLYKNTIEFRFPNASSSAIIWQNNINTFSKLLMACKNNQINMDYIDYRLRNAIKENVINKDLYDYIDLNDALEFVDIIFNNNRDKIYFLKQYLKDLSETRNNNILIRSEKII